jgi:hypothetical protein
MTMSEPIELFDKFGRLRDASSFTDAEQAAMSPDMQDEFVRLRASVRTAEAAKVALDDASRDLVGKVRHFQQLQAARFKPLSIAEREAIHRRELFAARDGVRP